MRVNLSPLSAGNSKLKFINALIRKFAESNDIKFGSEVKNYISTPQGSKVLATWAASKGYKVSFWCMESYKHIAATSGVQTRYEEIWVGFGIDVDESCPLIVELKLRTC